METEEYKRLKCSWCGCGGYMEFVSKNKPTRFFCCESHLHKWEWFNRNGKNWLKVKENKDGKEKN